MKFDHDIKREFKNQFGGESFTMEDARIFLEPYFEWDEEKERLRAQTNYARKFIQSFKDGEGIREALAYISSEQDEPDQISYNFFEVCEEEDILKRQELSLEAKIAGIFRTKTKVARRRFILANQMTIFDFIRKDRESAKEGG